LKNSPILILDEATSALDSEAEKYIQKAMKNLMKKKTVIAIAHRLSTLKEMDRIIVLEKGRIVEEGKIEDLMKAGGPFQHLWEMQEK
jgi:ABC-type multidrug transport system fused ATPase/permease subunit